MSSLYFVIVLLLMCIGFLLFKNCKLKKKYYAYKQEVFKNLAFIAHEIKNPLTAINNIAYYIKKMSNKKKISEGSLKISELSMLLTERLVGILNFAKVSLKKEKIDKKEIILKDFVECFMIKNRFFLKGSESRIFNKLEADTKINTSAELLEILFGNILFNAVKYTDTEDIIIASRKEDTKLVLFVKDFGKGISKDDQEHIFKIFYRDPSIKNVDGFGVGLSISKQLVKLLNWEIILESPVREGRGTCFSLIIPL